MLKRLLLCLVLVFCAGLAHGKNYEIKSFTRIFYDDNVFMRASGTANQTDTFYYIRNLKNGLLITIF